LIEPLPKAKLKLRNRQTACLPASDQKQVSTTAAGSMRQTKGFIKLKSKQNKEGLPK
jgi:hypothetical protein